MMRSLLSPKTSGKRSGKQIRKGLGLRGSKRVRDADRSCSGFARSLEAAGYDSFGALPMPKVSVRLLRHASCCFPHASPVSETRAGKQKTAPKDRSKPLISLENFGAGEGIRTLDPNLGNVRRRFTPQHLCLSQNHLRYYWIRSFLARRHPKPILLLPSDFRSGASPLLPRPPPAKPGKQIWEQAWNTRAGLDHG
jgi:hypothetical protein